MLCFSKPGGLIVIWDTSKFDINDATGGNYYLAIKGQWKKSGEVLIIVNVHGSHSDRFRDSSDRLNSQFHQRRDDRFNEFIVRNNLIDIAISGRKFTRISDDGLKFSKLDRFLVTDKFISLWDDLSIIALDRNLSDHCPLVLRDKVIDYRPKPFKVFDEWFNCEYIDKVIAGAWEQPIRGTRLDCIFRDRLKNVKLALKEWSKANFNGLDSVIKELQKEALCWELKAKSNVLSESDRATWKYNKYNLRGFNINGVWNEDPEVIKDAVFDHFQKVFYDSRTIAPRLVGCQPPNGLFGNSSIDSVGGLFRLSESEERIGSKVNEDEIWDALNECASVISKGCNSSFITMVSKKSDPIRLNDYWPISLIGSYYKIIAKLLSNHLRKVIPQLVGSEQNAFIKGRNIIDGVLIANGHLNF
ncbi:uncharacterized protein [Rutidosis leptorrhynchoides]|uniref:uncharacterized protein n=1 Tax=Rutidosis leptorrhynchoides TaxID=125765 RepID=UPI003A9955BA